MQSTFDYQFFVASLCISNRKGELSVKSLHSTLFKVSSHFVLRDEAQQCILFSLSEEGNENKLIS